MSAVANLFPMISNMVQGDLNHHIGADNTLDTLLYFRFKLLAINDRDH
nr:hypothetical protein [Mucilaginibacter sp. FT3.2]